MGNIYAVILAAGTSSRLGFNKLLVKIDGQSVIRKAVNPFLSGPVEKVFVVVGGAPHAVRAELRDLPVHILYNRAYRQGMSASVKRALAHLRDADGVFFHLADKPFLSTDLVPAMLAGYERDKDRIIVPVYGGEKGHPVLLDPEPYFEEMEGLTGDRGLREIIEKHWTDVLFIEGDEGSLFDIDTAQDIESLRRRGYSIEKG
jgi:molybdenum cofactor cytidylyltransferase